MIRSALPEEAEAVRQLVHGAYGRYIARLGKPPGPMLDDYGRRIADGQAWVLEDGGALAGVLVLEDAEGLCCSTTWPLTRWFRARDTDGR
jgi:hypothetical protein